jgi:hypothetical protein
MTLRLQRSHCSGPDCEAFSAYAGSSRSPTSPPVKPDGETTNEVKLSHVPWCGLAAQQREKLQCNRYDVRREGAGVAATMRFRLRELATTDRGEWLPRPPKEKWQSTPCGSQLAQDLPRCKNLAHKGLWHGLSEEGGRNGFQAYCVAVGSLAVWQSTLWVHGLVAAMLRGVVLVSSPRTGRRRSAPCGGEQQDAPSARLTACREGPSPESDWQ